MFLRNCWPVSKFSNGFVRADRVLELRRQLDRLGTVGGLTEEEKGRKVAVVVAVLRKGCIVLLGWFSTIGDGTLGAVSFVTRSFIFESTLCQFRCFR